MKMSFILVISLVCVSCVVALVSARLETPMVPDSASATPNQKTTLIAIRHGEGWHNVRSLGIDDAALTPRGMRQATSTGSKLREPPHQFIPQIILVSPLRRAIQTMFLAFPTDFIEQHNITVKVVNELREVGNDGFLTDFGCDIPLHKHGSLKEVLSAKELAILGESPLPEPEDHKLDKFRERPDYKRQQQSGRVPTPRIHELNKRVQQEIQSLDPIAVTNIAVVAHAGLIRDYVGHAGLMHAEAVRCDYDDSENWGLPLNCGRKFVLPDELSG